jgi:hypothetical protein
MANTRIELRQSGSTGNTPSLGVIANGELSLNYADGILYYKTASNTLGSIRTTQPAGLTTEIQFNDAGSFGSNTGLTFSKSTGYFKAPTIESTVNGTGENFKVGDDAWIGDVNSADSIRIKGQQNSANAYIIFGSSDTTKLGRAGTGPLTYGGAFTATGTVSGNELSSTQSSGNEGGQVNLAIPGANTSLTGQVTIDVFQNQLRFFQGDSAKGAYIDLTAASAGVGSNLLNPSATPDTLARETANAAFAQANSANILAQAAFNQANSALANTGTLVTANSLTQYSFANTALSTSTTTGSVVLAGGLGVTGNIYADAIYDSGVEILGFAQAAFNKANQTAQLAFTTVAANGTNLVADANNDTLTITANTANGIQVFANATTDTLDLGLRATGVTAGVYGNSSTAVTITIDQFGRITSVSQTAVTYTETDPLALAFAIALG